MKKILFFFRKRDVKVFLGMLLGTTIYCMGIVWVLDLGQFYAGGVTGVAQLISTVVTNIAGKDVVGLKSIIIIVLNIPLFIIGWGGVSKRFAILSLISVGLQSVLIALLEYFSFNPFFALSGQCLPEQLECVASTPDFLTMAILGGLVTGVGCGVCLRVGSSTGGLDILSQFFALKKNMSFAKFSLTIDLIIIGAAAIIGSPVIAVYTVVRMIISILVLDKIHTIYKYMKISIVTEEKQRMREVLITKFNHGVTIYTATGAYTNLPKYVFETVASSYEIEEYRNVAKQVDPHCFITYTAIKSVDGFFNRNIIA